MANLKTEYELQLQIKNGDRVKSTIADMDNSLKEMSKATKGLDFSAADKTAQDLANQIHRMATGTEDCTEEMEAFGKAANKAYKDLESSAVKLNHSLSEQGQQQRARIKELEAEKATLDRSTEGRKRAREIEKELKELKKSVVDASDDELALMLKQNVQTRARLKLAQQEAKNYRATIKQQKTLNQLLKDDLKPLRDRLSAMKDYIKALGTVEGKYKALKSLAKGAFSVGKNVLKAGAVGALALGGMAVASADRFVSQEREANRMKGGGSKEEKQALLGEIYAETGADYTSIVDAINRVYNVLGTVSKEELREAAVAEVKMPGLSALFRQQNVGKVTGKDYTAYMNRVKEQQKTTGATMEQITGSANYIANLRQQNFTNATESDLQGLYLALQGSGAFDTEDELRRAFERFVRKQRTSGVDVYDLAKQWQQSGEWTRTALGATNKTQVANTIKNVDFDAMRQTARMYDTSTHETEAEKTAKAVREMEVMKDKLLIEVLQAIKPFIESGALKKIITAALSILEKLVPYVDKFVSHLVKLINATTTIADSIGNQNEKETERQISAAESGSTSAIIAARSGLDRAMRFANGGIASVPSICGEGGFPEAVLPLDPSRASRASQIMATVNNTFNMAGSETTAMSLASALNSREFAFQSGRIGALNRRLGR